MSAVPWAGLRATAHGPRDAWNSTQKRLVNSSRLSAAFPSLDLPASLACAESLCLYNAAYDAHDPGSGIASVGFDFTFWISSGNGRISGLARF